MNMISTGAFLPEMDASNKQETIAEKFARVWEKKNSKVARAGGVSLMALSLAACGSSSTTTTTTTVTPTPTPDPEPTVPAGSAFTLETTNDNVFGTAGNDTVSATDLTFNAADVLADGSAADSDTLTVSAATDLTANANGATVVGFENVVFNATGTLVGGDTTFTTVADNIKGAVSIAVNATAADTLISAAAITGLDGAKTVTFGTMFTDVDATGATDADLVINLNTTDDVTFTAIGAADDLTVTSAGNLTIDAVAATEDLSVTAAGTAGITAASILGNVEVNATDDTTVAAVEALGDVSVTATGTVGVTVTKAAGTLTIDNTGATAGDDVTITNASAATVVNVTSVGGVTATANSMAKAASITINAQETSAITADAVADQVVNLNAVNADGDAVAFTLNASTFETLNLGGTSAINVTADIADVDDETVTSTNAVGATLTVNNASASSSLENVANNVVVRLGDDFDGDTLTTANTGAVIEVDAEQAQGTLVTLKAKTDTSFATNSVTLQTGDSVATDAVDDEANVTGLAFTDFATVNLVAAADTLAATGNVTGNKLTTLNISGEAAVTLVEVTGSATTAATVDASDLAANFALTLNSTANGAETVIGGSKVDTITVSAAAASGNDFDITLNAGNDVVDLNASMDIKIHGGAGTDTLKMDNVDLSGATLDLTSVEQITYDNGADLAASFIDGKTFIIDSTAGGDALTIVMDQSSVDLSSLAFTTGNAADNFVVDASAIGLATTLTGSSIIDNINGGAGADTIDGKAGNDVLEGEGGADTYTGGDGDDDILIDTVAHSAAAVTGTTVTFDTVTDFTSTEDQFDVGVVGDLLAGADATGVTVTAITTGAASLNDTTIADFAELKVAIDALGLVASAAGAAGAATGLQAYTIDLAGNTGALGTGKYLLLNNNDVAITAADVMIALDTTTVIAGDFIIS